jgi:hypothetical protein
VLIFTTLPWWWIFDDVLSTLKKLNPYAAQQVEKLAEN